MFEYGCPGRANGFADQPKEGVSGWRAGDRGGRGQVCLHQSTGSCECGEAERGERRMGSAQRVEVRGSGWTRQGEQVTLQAEGMRARLPLL